MAKSATGNSAAIFLIGIAPDTEARVEALVITSATYGLSLQAARTLVHAEEVWSDLSKAGPLDFLAFIASSLAVQVGLALFAFGLLLLQRKRSMRTAMTYALQFLIFFLMMVETGAQAYFFSTGQTLDWSLFAEALERPKEVLSLGLGSVPGTIWAALAFTALVVGVAPWVASARARNKKADLAAILRSRPKAYVACFGGIGIIFLGLLPGTKLANDSAAPRDPLLHLLVSALPRSISMAGFAAGRPENYFFVAIEPVPRAPSEPPTTPRNLVLIILESTGASATSVYNPQLPTTPGLVELAKKSLVVERMQAVIPATKKSLRHILCGFEASHSPKALSLGVMTRCLPNLLRARNYTTVFFQSADEHWDFRTASAFGMGFTEFYGPSSFDKEGWKKPNMAGWDDEIMLTPSRKWLSKHLNVPFIATYLTVDAHFACRPLERRANLNLSGIEDLNCYLNAVRHDDFFIQELIQQYRDLGLAKNTLFVIIGDHGEAFGEHGRRTHNDVPWQEALHVPVLIYDPNGKSPAPGVVKGNWAQTDLAPTLVELLGYRISAGRFQGFSLLHPPPADRIIHSACIGEESCLASLQGDIKVIDHFWHHKPEMFDLAADPLEKNNLAPEHKEETARRVAEMVAWDNDLKQHYAWFELHRSEPQAEAARAQPRAGKAAH